MSSRGDLSDIEFDETGTAVGWEDDDGGGTDDTGNDYIGYDPDTDPTADEIQSGLPDEETADEGTEEFTGQDPDDDPPRPPEDDNEPSGVDQIEQDIDEFQEETPEADPEGTESFQEQQEADPTPDTTTGEELRGEADFQQDLGEQRQDLSEEPVPTRVEDIGDVRFAQEETTIGGVTYQAGEALPPEEQIARDVERQFLESDAVLDRRYGRSDVEVTRTNTGRLDVGLQDRAVQREQREVRQRVARDVEGAEASDFRITDGAVVPTQQYQEERVADQVRESLGMPGWTAGEQFRVTRDRVSAEEAEIAQQVGNRLLPGADFQFAEQGGRTVYGAELTPEGREALISTRIAEQGYVEVEDEGTALPGTDIQIGAGTRQIDVEDIDQLQFDEEGGLTGVSQPDDPTMTENVEQLEEMGFDRATAIGLAGSRAAVDTAGDVSTDAAGWLGENVIGPGAEVVGAAWSPGPADDATVAAELATGEDLGEETPQQRFVGGIGGIATGAVSLPETVARGSEAVGEGAAFTVEEGPVEGAQAGAEVTAGALGEAAEYTIENPIESTGALAGSAAFMGGAGAISGRAGLATRAAIQPGEELLGYGGSAAVSGTGRAISRAGDVAPGRAGGALQRVGGGTERASDVLFPRNEPLFLSEEAAIMVGRRGVSLGRRAGARGRSAIGGAARRFDAPSISRERVLTPEGLETETQFDAGTIGRPGEIARGAAGRVGQRAQDIRYGLTDEFRRRRLDRPPQQELGDVTSPTVIDVEGGEARGAIVEDVPGQTQGSELGPFEQEGEAQPEGDAGAVGSNVISEVETQTDSGVVVQRVMGETETSQRVGVEQETPSRVETETQQEAIRTQPLVEETLVEEAQTPTVDVEERLGQEPVTEPFQAIEPVPAVETGVEQRGAVELETETETGAELEQEAEQELEQRLESRFELETETETRRELFGDEEDEGETGWLFGGAPGAGEEVLTDFANPLTGETIETGSDPRRENSVAEMLRL